MSESDQAILDEAREQKSCLGVAAVLAVALFALAVLWVGWCACQGVRLAFPVSSAAYPDPVCERCGLPLDGAHAACVPESDTRLSFSTKGE
jgi:hypothetical protein